MQPAFRALLERGDVSSIRNIRKHSRNTYVAYADVLGKPAVLKFNRYLLGSEGSEKVRQQIKVIESFLGADRQHIPRVLAHWPVYGVIALERCEYASIAEHLASPRFNVDRFGRIYGSAMRFFHERSTLSKPEEGLFLLHSDFSPGNLLVDVHGRDFCIIDVPERKVLGNCDHDIGVALFEIIRTTIKLKKLQGIPLALSLRRAFLSGYDASSKVLSLRELLSIYKREYSHAFQVMGRYLRFWGFPDWQRQFFRMVVLLPATIFLTMSILPLLQLAHAGSARNHRR